MKVKVRTVKEFRFKLTEQEFAVLTDALYEHWNSGASEWARETAKNMRDAINAALRVDAG